MSEMEVGVLFSIERIPHPLRRHGVAALSNGYASTYQGIVAGTAAALVNYHFNCVREVMQERAE